MTLTIRPATPADRVALLEQVQLLNLFEDHLVHDRQQDRKGAEAALDSLFERIDTKGGDLPAGTPPSEDTMAVNVTESPVVSEVEGVVSARRVLARMTVTVSGAARLPPVVPFPS